MVKCFLFFAFLEYWDKLCDYGLKGEYFGNYNIIQIYDDSKNCNASDAFKKISTSFQSKLLAISYFLYIYYYDVSPLY